MKFLKALPVLLLLWCYAPAFAQTVVLDSLFTVLKAEKNAAPKAQLLNLISGEYSDSDPDKALEYAKQALTVSRNYKLPQQQGDAWLNIGNANILLSKYTDALKAFTNSQSVYEELIKSDKSEDVKDGLARAYGSIGIVCNRQNNYARALEYFFKALKLYRETRQDDIAARIYNGIGVVYESQKEYDKALKYYKQALSLQEASNDDTWAVTTSNIGNIYLAMGRDDDALAAYKTAEKGLADLTDRSYLGELYNSYGNYYRKKGLLQQAKEYYNRALTLFNEDEALFGASATLEYLGRIAEQEKKYKEAVALYTKSAEYGAEVGATGQVKDSEKALSELYEKQGNLEEAFRHYKKYSAAHDSIVSSENIKALVREEMNFEFERKEVQRKLEIEKKQALYNEQAKRQSLLLIFGGLFSLLVFGIMFLGYNRRQIKKTLTLQRDLAEYEQKALHLQMNPHFVFNCLGAISGFIVQNGKDSAIKYLSKFSKLMRLTLEYSKESLIPIDKEIESLQNYLELEQLRFNQIFDFSIIKDAAIEDDMALPPLLVQPFVENAIMHGLVPKKERGTITVDFRLHNEKLICTITDDGVGMKKSMELKQDSVTVHKSMALEITRKRLEVIQAFTAKEAKVTIEDGADDQGNAVGTKITLYLPIQYLSDIK